MEALYWRRPSASEAAELGCRPEDYPEPVIEVWPEHWAAIQLFRRFSTQWRLGMAGPVGLDLSVIQFELARQGITGTEYDELMDRLQVIEQAALDFFHKDKA